MRAAIIKNGVVVNVTNSDTLDHPDGLEMVYSDTAVIGDTHEDGVFTPPEPIPAPVILDVLSTDLWTIPADGTTFASVTYTSNETVYFAVGSEIFEIEPVAQVANLEVSASTPGPIRVEVKNSRLVIAALAP